MSAVIFSQEITHILQYSPDAFSSSQKSLKKEKLYFPVLNEDGLALINITFFVFFFKMRVIQVVASLVSLSVHQ